MNSNPPETSAPAPRTAPSLLTMHFAFILTGLGTAMLGPILPLLTREGHLSDQQSGLLLLAQFCGSFLGGATMTTHLRRDLLLGVAASALGLAAFAHAPGLLVACPALLLTGWGLGHSITAVNVLAGERFTHNRASRLALLNFFWSFGAMLAPVLTALLTPHAHLSSLLLGFAALFFLCGTVMAAEMRASRLLSPPLANPLASTPPPPSARGLPFPTFAFFATMLFFYGGVETCLSGWLTTYALRYGDRTLVLSESATLLLWLSLTLGRAASAALLRRLRETSLWRAALVASALLTLALGAAHTALAINTITLLLGFSLAPWFPITFALLMGERPTGRQAGLVIAVSGLGAAALPSLMGAISTHAGSLQRALIIPFLGTLVLLAMSLRARAGAERPLPAS